MRILERVQVTVTGVVQGVGFRPFVWRLATELGVCGSVANRAGDVVIEAEAEPEVLARFIAQLHDRRPERARVDRVYLRRSSATGAPGFAIAASEPAEATTEEAASIAPDSATCEACLDEIFDAGGRRDGYAFTSCAACGPRLTIVTGAPYDRERTTMVGFAMCADCRAEYDDPSDRRFHAQPIACPACGPTLATWPLHEGDPIAVAVAALARGEILALKGLGGYHLACDATQPAAVRALRERKHRDAKPLAVMVPDLATAHRLATLDFAEAALLASAARPIVLVRRRAGSELAPEVAPELAELGLMLPYTPLHHLLLRAAGGPLVMTSGNVIDEPIAFRDDDARARLAPIADRFLVHDRPIHTRCEDSVARIVDGAPMLLRRARGYAPASLPLPAPLAVSTLALGGHGKAVFALGSGETAYLSPHLGDLDELLAYEGYLHALDHFGALHHIAPRRLVHDLHPDYATTRLAESLSRSLGTPVIAVQHHRAHFASALADTGSLGPAIGVCFDGGGLGDDGTSWGGELLVGDLCGVRRAAHLRAVALPGGDRAAAEPWRMAVAHLLAAGEPIDDLAQRIGPQAHRVAALCVSAPRTTSIGRLFDAVAALAGICDRVSFEGQAAMQLEALARTVTSRSHYPIEITAATEPGGADLLDPAPIIRGVMRDLRSGHPPAVIARRFHTTIVELTASACERVAAATRLGDVYLTGGVFQNALLAGELPARLRAAGLAAHVHRRVPPNDGGLALGQLAIAAALDGAA